MAGWPRVVLSSSGRSISWRAGGKRTVMPCPVARALVHLAPSEQAWQVDWANQNVTTGSLLTSFP